MMASLCPVHQSRSPVPEGHRFVTMLLATKTRYRDSDRGDLPFRAVPSAMVPHILGLAPLTHADLLPAHAGAVLVQRQGERGELLRLAAAR